MPAKYRIHPAIGIARLGDSPDEFYISPEKPAAMPIACDAQGNALMSPDGKSEAPVTRFKDASGRIKRQAARFQIYAYDEEHPEGRLLRLGDQIEGGGNAGTLVDIQWRVWVANKKSVWYSFSGLEGEHGYSGTHPRRNADITGDDARQQLIIDPGPRFVDSTSRRRASFDRDGNGVYATRFPPKGMRPHDIDTLGEILTDDHGCLLVLGGHGKSGTFKTGVGQPVIENYANTDGWFDDISDGPVMARLVMYSKLVGKQRFVDVEYPAWVVTGYPRYAPQILDLVTIEDVVYDLSIRKFAYRTDLYGIPNTWDQPPRVNDAGALMHWNAAPLDWNPDYKPWFYRDVWPILFRADEMSYLNNVLQQSNYPHNQTQRGNFDVTRCCVPPLLSPRALTRLQRAAIGRNQSGDLFLDAIQIKLQMFDDAVERALHGKIRTQGSTGGGATPENAGPQAKQEVHGNSLFAQLRAVRSAVRDVEHRSELDSVAEQYESGLKSAAAAFAHDVLPQEGLSPTEYLHLWRAANEQDALDYTAASQRLKEAVDEALEPFIRAAIAHWEGGLSKVETLAALLHSPDAQSEAPARAREGRRDRRRHPRHHPQDCRRRHDALPHGWPDGNGIPQGHRSRDERSVPRLPELSLQNSPPPRRGKRVPKRGQTGQSSFSASADAAAGGRWSEQERTAVEVSSPDRLPALYFAPVGRRQVFQRAG